MGVSPFLGMLRCRLASTLLFSVLMLLVHFAYAQKLFWTAQSVVGNSSTTVNLSDKDGAVIGTVNRAWIERMLNIHNRLQVVAGTSADLSLTDGSQPNAFAWPDKNGQHIAINLGMLRVMGEDEHAAAALLGHETAHLVRGHSQSSQERRAGLSALGSIANIILATKGIRGGDLITDLGTRLIDTSYNRDQEREADELGVRYIHSIGFEPMGAVRLQEMLVGNSRSFSLPFLSSHPSGDERIQNMRLLTAQYTPPTPQKPIAPIQIAKQSLPPVPQQQEAAPISAGNEQKESPTPPDSTRPAVLADVSSSAPASATTAVAARKRTPQTESSPFNQASFVATTSSQAGSSDAPKAPEKEIGQFAFNGLAPARMTQFTREEWGYINKAGDWVIPPAFAEAQPFDNAGWAAVAVGNAPDLRWGFINARGEWEVAPQFGFAESFDKEVSGFAKVRLGSASFGESKYVGRNGAVSDRPGKND